MKTLILFLIATTLHAQQTPQFGLDTKNTKLIGIGESVHGSKDYNRLRFDLLRYFVEHKGTRLVMWEMSDTRLLEAYLKGEHNDVIKAMHQNDWRGKTEQNKKIFQWMRAFNDAHPLDPIVLKSVDPQCPWYEYQKLKDILREIIPDIAQSTLQALHDNCFGASHKDFITFAFSDEMKDWMKNGLPPEKHQRCMDALDSLENLKLDEVRGLKAYQLKSFYINTDTRYALSVRDRVMALRIQDALKLKYDNRPAIYFAHNLHLAKTGGKSFQPEHPWYQVDLTGGILAEVYQDEYKTISLSGYEVEGVFKGAFPKSNHPDSIEKKLLDNGMKNLTLISNQEPWLKEREWYFHDEVLNGRKLDAVNDFNYYFVFPKAYADIHIKEESCNPHLSK
ncbi:MAG: erythromycin esterase family protein [Bacteriovoracaceae bacterium]|nr:erythromycin esterase family protein [Bacteriovoracaceae bacterium]